MSLREEDILPRGEVGNLFLTSGTKGYMKAASELAGQSEIRVLVEHDHRRLTEVIDLADFQCWKLSAETTRTLTEVRLAVLLVIIAEAGGEQAREFLEGVGRMAKGNATWVAALARKLLEKEKSVEKNPSFDGARRTTGKVPVE